MRSTTAIAAIREQMLKSHGQLIALHSLEKIYCMAGGNSGWEVTVGE